ncbi:MAG TPA: DUF4292 domain-containing protein [Prolixibacteraceae bacterium]|nr:DUF4292 domain-containing protein [Prolixibacteraceae bacterium]
MKRIKINIFISALAAFAVLGFSSCRSTKIATTTTTVVKPMNTNKLIRNIESNVFDYKHLAIKKINCQFDNGKTKVSLRASIFAEKNKQIVVMLSKLNIPVGRLWLTPDSVKFINYLEKNYLLDDYSYLSSMMDMDIDFETVNAIISNNIFALGDQKANREIRDYEAKIDSGMYVLESEKKLKMRKENGKMSERRQARKARKIVPDSPVKQSIYVDPETFKLTMIKLVDSANSRKLNIGFSDFVAVDKQLYPGEMALDFKSPESSIQLQLKFSGFSTDAENDVRFRVPEKYTRINHQ